jgi:farnesyl diphosphate synthase
MHGMVGGQMMDIVAESGGFDLQTVTRLQQLKTGGLLAAAVEMGAVLGRVAVEGRTHLRGFARDIGLAFQIADDLLDHEGDEEAAGKALRKDAEAGKQTFVSLLGADRAREQARMLVEQAIAHLHQHGHEADLLRALARFIVERDR